MLFLISYGQDRPSVLEKKKDEEYHLKWGRYCVGQANNNYQAEYVQKIKLNKRFYIGKQWILDEDLEAFFKDDTGQNRNRIKIVKNLIRPMIEQYRGNAIRMTINAKVKSVSPMAITRREEKLKEALFYSRVANQENNPYAEKMKKQLPIGDTDQETGEIFDNLYQDEYVQKMNYLLEFVSNRNKFDHKQLRIAEELSLAGIAVLKTFEHGGHQQFQITESENFFFDRSAAEYDLTDAGFMGEVWYGDGPDIYEKYPDMTTEQRQAVENYVKQWKKVGAETGGVNSTSSSQQNKYDTGGKIPVFRCYWKDSESFEYGYVRDEYGYPYLTKINFVHEGEEKPRYTDKDLIEVNTVRAKRVLRGQKKRKLFVDSIRFCEFIPREIMGSSNGGSNKFADIILDWGLAPYQETESTDFNNVQFPFKCYCWGYVDGEILSPIDDAINPQRFVNRILSVAENQINNSRGSGIMYDKSALDPDEGEAGMLRNMNQSKPVGFKAKGLGIQNIASTYDTSVKAGTTVLFNIIDTMKNYVQETTGINEALQGESTGSDQLVGVTQLLIQRGSLMQEPFYNAITQIFLQAYQSIAIVGKRIYCDNERNLSCAVGDEGAKVIKLSRDMKLEDFRCFVKRENTDEILTNAANQMLTTFLQMGLIDRIRFANLYGRSTPDDITAALRQAGKEQIEIGRSQKKAEDTEAKQVQAGMEEASAASESKQHEEQARADIMDMTNKRHDTNKELIKTLGKLAPANPAAGNQILEMTKNMTKQPVV